jgi:hypothetical protein
VKESWPLASIPLTIATRLAILGLAAHNSTLLMTPGHPMSAGGCGLSATIYYLSSPGLTAGHGPARARSLTRSRRRSQAVAVKENRPLASIPLTIATLLAILGSAAHSATLLMIPGYPVSTGG